MDTGDDVEVAEILRDVWLDTGVGEGDGSRRVGPHTDGWAKGPSSAGEGDEGCVIPRHDGNDGLGDVARVGRCNVTDEITTHNVRSEHSLPEQTNVAAFQKSRQVQV